MEHIVLEVSFDPSLTPEEHLRIKSRVRPCLERYGAQWVCSYLSRDRRRMICVFEAPDTESVRAAFRSANAGFERAWAAEVFVPQESAAAAD